jgi:hypothetical protein
VGKDRPGSDPKNWTGPFLYSRGRSWNLGKHFVKEKLPPELSKRVIDSPWYVQEVINARVANSLWVMGNSYYYDNAAFRKTVDMEEKARTNDLERAIEKAHCHRFCASSALGDAEA